MMDCPGVNKTAIPTRVNFVTKFTRVGIAKKAMASLR